MTVDVRKVAGIARANLVRLVRDRGNLFFVFVFPLALVLLLGQQFGGGLVRTVGLVGPGDDPLVAALGDGLGAADGVEVRVLPDEDALVDAVARDEVAAGVVVPADATATLRDGGDVTIEVLGRAGGGGDVRALVGGVLGPRSTTVTARRVVTDVTGVAADVPPDPPPTTTVSVAVEEVGAANRSEFAGLGRFDLSASSQLLLFMFVTSLSGSAQLIQSRALGVTRRMLASPTSVGTVLVGEAAGRFAVAVAQGAWVVLGTVTLFGVDWGDPLGTLAVVVLFGAVCAGAALLLGALFDNDSQAGGAGVGIGLAVSALGGSMVPVEVFPADVRWLVRLTPHGWGNEAFAELVRRDGTVLDVAAQLGVLALMAAGLLVVATWLLRRRVVGRL